MLQLFISRLFSIQVKEKRNEREAKDGCELSESLRKKTKRISDMLAPFLEDRLEEKTGDDSNILIVN